MIDPQNKNINPKPDYDTSQPRETLTRVRKKKKKYKKVRPIYIIAGVIAGIILLLLIIWLIGMLNMHAQPGDPGKELWYKGHKYVFNENITTTLFIGYDQTDEDRENNRAGQADYIMLMALDNDNKRVRGISIPRDMMTKITRRSQHNYIGLSEDDMQIALAYAYADGGKDSAENTRDTVSRLLYNMPINTYFCLNTDGIGPLSTAIGGVTLVAKEDIPNTKIVKGQKITLMGENARNYVKRRFGDIDASERRRERDVQFMEEYYKQAFPKISNNPNLMVNLYNEGNKYAVSNYGIPELLYMSTSVFSADINHFETLTLKGEKKMGTQFVEIWPDDTQVFETVLSVFYNMVE